MHVYSICTVHGVLFVCLSELQVLCALCTCKLSFPGVWVSSCLFHFSGTKDSVHCIVCCIYTCMYMYIPIFIHIQCVHIQCIYAGP